MDKKIKIKMDFMGDMAYTRPGKFLSETTVAKTVNAPGYSTLLYLYSYSVAPNPVGVSRFYLLPVIFLI